MLKPLFLSLSRFGVCCLFLVTGTGDEISQNCSYIQNAGFPMAYTDMASSIQHMIRKCDDSKFMPRIKRS